MADFIPRSDDEVVAWCANFVGKLGTHGATVGLSTTEVTDLKKHCEDTVAALQQSGKKRAEYQSAVAAAEAAKVTHLGPVRAQLRRMKTHPAWTEVIGRDLQALSSTGNTIAMDELVPDLEAKVLATGVVLKFKKGPLDGVNLYVRRQGEQSWRFLARDNRSPYEDKSPSEKPGQLEQREYRAVGVVADAEVGQPSKIVSVAVSQ